MQAADLIHKDKIKEGEVYCGQYAVDGKYYRVRIKKVLPNSQFLVEFVDYGNEDFIELKQLRNPHRNELFKLPFQVRVVI